MANKRGNDWPNTQLQNLHGSLKQLLICVANEKGASARKGRRTQTTGKTVQQALDEVQEDLDDVAEHPYNNVHSSANPGDKRLEPAARGPVRQLHMELKRLVEAADPEAHEEKVKEHLKSLVSLLAPSHLESEATAKGSTEEEPVSASSDRVLRDVEQQDMNVDRMFDRAFEGVTLEQAAGQDKEQDE